ncbi:MAG: hypothetical protein R3350_07895, partial [Saprospiraceae bacterium]|nr:hypothetical protein [Saprospiraceae bacterium]
MEDRNLIDSNAFNELELTGQGQSNLFEAAGWAKFLAIIGFVFVGFLVLGSFFVGTVMNEMFGSDATLIAPGAFSLIYLLLAAVYFLPVLFLFRFASQMRRALQEKDQHQLESSLAS